ncbi:MAG TPA: thioredoxin family protein [Candidatus Ozemobacteraceae bacterium]|nr:thioredoxin family protein [Candidatus Ozemobacteraceae bacterium]
MMRRFALLLALLCAALPAFAQDAAPVAAPAAAPVAAPAAEPAPAVEKTPATPTSSAWNTFFPDGLINSAGEKVELSVLDNKIVGLYFSAHWCPPCRAFSPKLVEFRNKNKDQFEVVFISSDKNETAQFEYMKEVGMEWPTMKHRSEAANALAEKFGVQGIPTLIILSPTGETVSTSGRMDVTDNPDGCIAKWKEGPAK